MKTDMTNEIALFVVCANVDVFSRGQGGAGPSLYDLQEGNTSDRLKR
jgi:hypothetical protein